jgi:hypothetical protein
MSLFVVERCWAFAGMVDAMIEKFHLPKSSTSLYPLLAKDPQRPRLLVSVSLVIKLPYTDFWKMAHLSCRGKVVWLRCELYGNHLTHEVRLSPSSWIAFLEPTHRIPSGVPGSLTAELHPGRPHVSLDNCESELRNGQKRTSSLFVRSFVEGYI